MKEEEEEVVCPQIRFHKVLILITMLLHGSETWILTKRISGSLKMTGLICLQRMKNERGPLQKINIHDTK
jgi:hypothetical protein